LFIVNKNNAEANFTVDILRQKIMKCFVLRGSWYSLFQSHYSSRNQCLSTGTPRASVDPQLNCCRSTNSSKLDI